MKKIMIFTCMIVSLAFSGRDKTIVDTLVVVSPESVLSVKGTTNINTFTCSYNVDQLKKPIPVFFEKIDDRIIFEKTALVLENSNFDCGGKGINSDFQKILKSDEHPKIYLFLKALDTKLDTSSVIAHVDINIAGITNAYQIPITFMEKNGMFINGKVSISLRDFKMKAPKKLFGLIEVENSIEIDFQLVIKECQP